VFKIEGAKSSKDNKEVEFGSQQKELGIR